MSWCCLHASSRVGHELDAGRQVVDDAKLVAPGTVAALHGPGESERLDGRIEMDDAYLGGERSGGKTGRGSPGKKPIVVAVQTSDDGRPRRIKLRRIARFKRKRVKTLTRSDLPGFFGPSLT